jgi:glyoxylase-like metal-dependent hydrolase (beta-lactamase superfamily II)
MTVNDEMVFSDEALEVRRLSVSEMDNRCYLLTDRASGEQVLIDAADDAGLLLEWLGAHGNGTVTRVLTTHSHWDHTRALADVVDATGAETVAGHDDVAAIAAERGVGTAHPVTHGEVLGAGSALEMRCVGLRGHTPGSTAFVLVRPTAGIAFTGDSLFPGGVGNTDHDADRFASLLKDVTERLFAAYPDETVVYPGHGEGTTLGAQRPHLDEWRARGW